MYVSVEQMFEKCPEGLVYAQGIAYRDSVLGLILGTIACIITAYLMKVSHNEEIDKLHEMYASQLSDRDSIYKDCREDAEKRLRTLTEYASKSINSHARMQKMAFDAYSVSVRRVCIEIHQQPCKYAKDGFRAPGGSHEARCTKA